MKSMLKMAAVMIASLLTFFLLVKYGKENNIPGLTQVAEILDQ